MTDPLRGSELPAEPSGQIAADKRVAHNLGPLVGSDGKIASAAPSDPSLDEPALVGTAARLAVQAERLADEVKGLHDTADRLAKRTNRNEWALALTSIRTNRNEWALALTSIGLAIDIALSIFAFVLLNNQSASNVRFETYSQGRCVLYSVLIPSYSVTDKAVFPGGPAGYDTAYRRMQADADHLNCGVPHRI